MIAQQLPSPIYAVAMSLYQIIYKEGPMLYNTVIGSHNKIANYIVVYTT